METVTYNKMTLKLTQYPYYKEDCNGVVAHYRARAVDAQGGEYWVKWEIIDHDTEEEDGSCNWHNYSVEEA
jgi:hypothetical protein